MAKAKEEVVIGIINGLFMSDILATNSLLKNFKTKHVYDTPYGKPEDNLHIGQIDGVTIVLLNRHGEKQRVAPGNVNYRANIWALKSEGVTHILATNSLSPLKDCYKAGDIAVLGNFIDGTKGRKATFYDNQPGHFRGSCYLTVEPPFNDELCDIITKTAKELKLHCHSNTIGVVTEGPRFMSFPEKKMYRQIGVDFINMSTVPEVLLAKELGIIYAAICLVTDFIFWVDIHLVNYLPFFFKEHGPKINLLLIKCIPKIAKKKWKNILDDLQEEVKRCIM